MDFDNDGITDLVLGNREGTILFYKRASNLSLQSPVSISDNSGNIKIDNNSKATVIDWNGDGLLDLFVSGGDTLLTGGTVGIPIRYYQNEGTKENYKFGNYVKVEANDQVIEFLRCYTQIIDFNNDGKLDLIASKKVYSNGSTGTIYFFENIGGSGTFNLKNGIPLKYSDGSNVETLGDAHFCFNDWNEDGIHDLLWTQYPSGTPEDYVYVSYGSGSVDNINFHKSNNLDKSISYSINNNSIKLNTNHLINKITIYNVTGKRLLQKVNPENLVPLPHNLKNRLCIVRIYGVDWSSTIKFIIK